MDANSYKEIWNFKASDPMAAMTAVDGSYSEEGLRHTGRWSANQVSNALGVTGSDRVLELGCGVGRIGRELAPQCAQWLGVDISDNMISHARERLASLDNVTLHNLSRTSLEAIGDGEVDKAYSIAVFCHMDKEDLYLYLRELHRVLRPGGLIFVETWNLASDIGWRRWEYEPLVWAQTGQAQRKDIARNQFCTPEEFELYVRKAGFQVVVNYNDSQSVQIIAGKELDEGSLAAEQARQQEVRAEVEYSPLFADFFGQFVDMLFGTVAPAEVLDHIDEHTGSTEADLYRPYLLALWEQHVKEWGEIPGRFRTAS